LAFGQLVGGQLVVGRLGFGRLVIGRLVGGRVVSGRVTVEPNLPTSSLQDTTKFAQICIFCLKIYNLATLTYRSFAIPYIFCTFSVFIAFVPD
jgi:hypothetical protein